MMKSRACGVVCCSAFLLACGPADISDDAQPWSFEVSRPLDRFRTGIYEATYTIIESDCEVSLQDVFDRTPDDWPPRELHVEVFERRLEEDYVSLDTDRRSFDLVHPKMREGIYVLERLESIGSLGLNIDGELYRDSRRTCSGEMNVSVSFDDDTIRVLVSSEHNGFGGCADLVNPGGSCREEYLVELRSVRKCFVDQCAALEGDGYLMEWQGFEYGLFPYTAYGCGCDI